MKTIKDITHDQAIVIGKLAYGIPEWIQSEIDSKYVPETDEDNIEFYSITFDAYSFGDKIDRYRVMIMPNLDLSVSIVREQESTPYLITIIPRNQCKIQNQFREWNIYPQE